MTNATNIRAVIPGFENNINDPFSDYLYDVGNEVLFEASNGTCFAVTVVERVLPKHFRPLYRVKLLGADPHDPGDVVEQNWLRPFRIRRPRLKQFMRESSPPMRREQ